MAYSILYVEDNAGNRMLIKRVLEALDFSVIFAETAKEALEIFPNIQVDLILMDINLPDLDGYTLTSLIRKFPTMQDVPIIALTANVMKGDKEKSLEAGCDGYIQKPIDIEKLPRTIKSYIEDHKNLQ